MSSRLHVTTRTVYADPKNRDIGQNSHGDTDSFLLRVSGLYMGQVTPGHQIWEPPGVRYKLQL